MSADEVQVIGVDCAVDPKRVGLARALWSEGSIRELEIFAPSREYELIAWIVDRVRTAEASLLAMDSPLGWPATLGVTLAGHRAGAPIEIEPDAMFRRLTDRIVRRRIGKQPLEVGADRIARTALAALRLLGEIGSSMGEPVELAWNRRRIAKASAIETYPAAWLLSRDLPARRYKDRGPGDAERRAVIVARLEGLFAGGLARAAASLSANAHLLDAVICVLCGADFLGGGCLAPSVEERGLARKEGWIWFPVDPD